MAYYNSGDEVLVTGKNGSTTHYFDDGDLCVVIDYMGSRANLRRKYDGKTQIVSDCDFTSIQNVPPGLMQRVQAMQQMKAAKMAYQSLATSSNSNQTTNPNTKMKFQRGDVVVLTSKRHGDCKDHPLYGGTQGKLKGVVRNPYDSDGDTQVEWENGCDHYYKEADLTLYTVVQEEERRKVDTQKKNEKVKFDSVIMPQDKKDAILAAISQMDHTDTIFSKWGFGEVFEKGTAVSLLFYGLPGTGKTLMAQAIADKMGHKLLSIGPADIETSTPGGAERNIRRYFKIASGKLPTDTGEVDKEGKPIQGPPEKHVLLFDECDSLITQRENVGIILRGQINTLLTELEYFDGIVIFNTNSIQSLDPAMERRITSKIEFEFPNQEMRKKIWMRMIPKKAPLEKDVDFDKLAEFPFAGGNIKNIVLNAARHAAYSKMKKISYDCFLNAMEREAEGLKAFEATRLQQTGRPHKKIGSVMSNDVAGGIRLAKETIEKDSVVDKVVKKVKEKVKA